MTASWSPVSAAPCALPVIGTSVDEERVYRVTVKPVTGDVAGNESGLKLLVGYDLLVLVRPPVVRNAVRSERSGAKRNITNGGNAIAPFRTICRQILQFYLR